MTLHLAKALAERISALARQTGCSPLTLVHQAVEEFLKRNESSDTARYRLMASAGDYEPQ